MLEIERAQELAKRHAVKRLELFGSAARGETPNDLDFLVEFLPLPPLEHGRAYLALLEGLQTAFGMRVDLLETEAVHNPYFFEAIQADRVLIYAA